MKLLNSYLVGQFLHTRKNSRRDPYARGFHIDFVGNENELGRMLDATFGFIDELDLEPALSNNVMLCAEELLRNVVLFSKTPSARLDITYSESDVSLIILDRGIPFDSVKASAEAHTLGLTLIHSFSAEWIYRRKLGANINVLRWHTQNNLNEYPHRGKLTETQIVLASDKKNRMPIIRLRGIRKTYFGESPLCVLKGIDLDIEKGESVSIMGASGSGKSTLLNVIGVLDNYDEGEYLLGGSLVRNPSRMRASLIRNELMGFVFQSFNLISFKNALENVALPLYYRGVDKATRNRLAMEYLDKLGLSRYWDHTPSQLSGGQCQRVAIARALITHPQIILADEPTGALDSKTTQEVMDILKKINEEDGRTLIIVTHEPDIALQTKRRILIKDGVIFKDERA